MKLTGMIAKEGLGAFAGKPELREGKRIPRIWVVVADKGITRIFRKPDGHLELIGEIFPEEETETRLENKTVGRVVSSGGGGSVHHKYEPHMDASRQNALFYAREFSDWLGKAVQENVFDRLVLVAAPQTLGDLRSVMDEKVQRRIIAEVDKDLTKLNERELFEALGDVLWF